MPKTSAPAEELRHHTEQSGGKTIIRNPTKEEVDNLEKANGVIGEPAKRPKKQQSRPDAGEYGCEMKERTSAFEPKPVEFFLPSGTKIVDSPGVTQRGSIYIRRVTTVEESIIQNALMRDAMGYYSITPGEAEPITLTRFLALLNDVINPCIRSNVDVRELSIIDKLPLLLKLISMTYGGKVEAQFECDECGLVQPHQVDLERDVIVSPIPEDFVLPRRIALVDSFDFQVDVDVTIPLVGDEGAFVGSEIDILKQYESIIVGASGVKPDGTAVTIKDLPDIVDNLGDEDKKSIRAFIAEYTKFGSDLTLRPFVLCSQKGKKGSKCKMSGKPVSDARLPLQTLLECLM